MENIRYCQARQILGDNFLTPTEVAMARQGVIYTPEQSIILAESLPSREVLQWCEHHQYGAMPAPYKRLSTIEVRDLHPDQFYEPTDGWFAGERFAHQDQTSPGWLLVKTVPVLSSLKRSWTEQTPLLSKHESVPNAAEMNWFITTYFAVRGIRLFKEFFVRTSSLDTRGQSVGVGNYDKDGLSINYFGNDSACYYLGLAAYRPSIS